MRTNAEVFARGAKRLGCGWAIGAWFVPLANPFLPYRIAVTTWGSSTPLAAGGGYSRFPLTLVNLWWGTFVLARLLGWYGGMSYTRAESADAGRDAATTMLVGDVLDLVAAVLVVLFVRKLTDAARQGWAGARGRIGVAEDLRQRRRQHDTGPRRPRYVQVLHCGACEHVLENQLPGKLKLLIKALRHCRWYIADVSTYAWKRGKEVVIFTHYSHFPHPHVAAPIVWPRGGW
ncbi:DUF4328 domain-containing protein [Streptomyces sp. NPDC058701]|uniref:DUF4328 domain-containing protein n=1 Tax=Streptomyces sp. NPDC058701 TaxID=3346608 RepID=UPI003651BF53